MSIPAPTEDSRRARRERFLHPSYGWCGRCGRPWAKVEPHTTYFGAYGLRGCFPLCEGCWSDLGHPEARILFYAALTDPWRLSPEERLSLGRAVAAGL